MHLTVALPGLLWPTINHLEDIYPSTPCFNQLLKHSHVKMFDYNYTDLLYSSFLMDSHGSIAYALAQKLNIMKHSTTKFLLIEPTHLSITHNDVGFIHPTLLHIDPAEAKLIIHQLNQHFSDICHLHYIHQNLWLLAHNLDVTNIKFDAPLDIIGQNLHNYMSDNKNSLSLNKLINEIQMLLYNLPINAERVQSGKLTINSLWAWDKDIYNMRDILHYNMLYSNTLNTNMQQYPVDYIVDNIGATYADNNLYIIDNLYYSMSYADHESWQQQLVRLDKTLAYTLLTDFNNNIISSLDILIPSQQYTAKLHLEKHSKYKFWRNNTLHQINQTIAHKSLNIKKE